MTASQMAMCAAFEAMDREQQLEVLQKEGVYIGKLKTGGHRLLYQYKTIYVEIIYTVHRGEVQQIHCHTDTTILDAYFSAESEEHNQFPPV